MTREEIEKAKEYQFAKAAMERRWSDESPIEAFEEGAEYGYKFAVEKACEWIGQQQEMLEDSFSDVNDLADLLKEAMEEEQ